MTTSQKKRNTSRLSAMALALGMAATAAMPAQAQTVNQQQGEWTKTKTSIVAGTTIAGTVLAGPIGLVLGLAAGDQLGNSVNKANAADGKMADMAAERDQAIAQLTKVQEQLITAREEAGRYQTLAMNSLQLNVMFSTSGDTLNARDKARLDVLARLLKEQPQLMVQLEGFADPRGSEAFNQKLSERRAASVSNYLAEQGVEGYRINQSAYGSSQSEAPQNNLDAYAMERVVTVKLQESREGYAAK
ncbi:OmpA family protein [Sansalvadorimonas verongulae]|uniref:OmpA family protein n=1 Tax=Sansalvadorimonas verongulae TaxID=2172824 RepID=UPI0012BB740C|nr:OmpA family protein [Sansalvadorimonas verongulae]MTI13535.1 hypothetical protein [Sansalvadorimonas verongulae]